jgi:hypothetical protein
LQWIPSRRQVNVWILVGGTTWNYVGVLNGLIPGPWGTPLFPMVYVQNASATVDFAPTFLPPGSQTWNGVTQANILPPLNIIPDAYDKAANAVLSLHNTSFLMSSGSGGVRGSHYIQYGFGAKYFFTGTVATAPTIRRARDWSCYGQRGARRECAGRRRHEFLRLLQRR